MAFKTIDEDSSSPLNLNTTTRPASACSKNDGLHAAPVTPEERTRFNIPAGYDVEAWGQCPEHGRYPRRVMGTAWRDTCPECAKGKAEREAFGRVAIPRRYAQCTVSGWLADTPDQLAVKRAVIDFCKNIGTRLDHGDSMIFSGLSGTGKTHLACAIARCAHQNGKTARFVKARALVSDIRATWRRDSAETETDALRRYVDLDLLVIDEVGAQFGTEAEALHLFDVIGERYAEQKSTILITNLPIESAPGGKSLRNYIGDAAFDRFMEDGSAAYVFSWDSWRGRAHGTEVTA